MLLRAKVKKRVDLNSDMGEGFGAWRIGDGVDDQIMPLISSANIATGFHAGDPSIMRNMVRLAKEHGVSVGAHPGFRDLVGFGRRHINASAEELVDDMVYQLGALREFTRMAGVALRHFKPHGALYMHAANDEHLSRCMISALQSVDPDLNLYCMQQSATYRVAAEMRHPTVTELYADRDYDRSGSIVFRRQVGRLDPQTVANKVLRACQEGLVQTVDGADVSMEFDSVCIHSDTPGALELIRATRELLTRHGIEIRGLARPTREPSDQ